MLLALTGKGPYVGTTTIGNFMKQYHVLGKPTEHINMSTALIEAYAKTLVSTTITAAYIKDNKAHFRKELQDFGHLCGFQDSPGPFFTVMFAGVNLTDANVVIEKVRTDAQAMLLARLGFKIIEVTTPLSTRIARAARLGVVEERLFEVMANPVEQGISPWLLDGWVTNDGDIGEVMHEIVEILW